MKRRLLACGFFAVILSGAVVFFAGFVPRGQSATAAAPEYKIDWAPCADSPETQCGMLRVPLDWSKPRGRHIAVAVARRAAGDPSQRVGTLFYNPGGPGDGGVRYIMAADQIFSATLRTRFDIVAMDPRGVGASTPIKCGIPVLTPHGTLFPRSKQEFQQLRRHNLAVGRSCLRESGPLVGHVDTISVARDHEALRIALDVPQVSWLGFSYGSQLGANYAQLYPRRTRAMVLDAALEHSGSEVLLNAEEISTVEKSFNRFTRWCRTASACALRGQDVAGIYDRLVARADRQPIPVEGALRPVTGEDIRMGTPVRLTSKQPGIHGPEASWPGLSKAIKQAVAGHAAGFALPPPENQAALFSIQSIGCMEYVSEVRNYDDMRQRMQMGRQLAPHLQGATETWQILRCIDWPLEASNPLRRLDVRGVPTLIVNATHDPSTSYKWAHGLAGQIHGSDILTRTGDGHTSYYVSECARQAMDGYLIHPAAPPVRVCKS